MNPVVIDFGTLTVRAYTAWVTGGFLLASAILVWRAYTTEHDPGAISRWLDVGIAGLIAGLLGARALHVALEWDYFADRTGEIDKIWLGGMAWHGGILAALPAILIVAWLRNVPVRAWTDAAALAFPVSLAMTWRGCRNAGCGYGYEVQTLADWSAWQVAELPDVFGLIAPRLDIQAAGTGFGAVLFVIALLLTWQGWLPGLRLWLLLALAGIGMLVLGYLRADPAQLIADSRADQVFNGILVVVNAMIGGGLWLFDRRTLHRQLTADTVRMVLLDGGNTDESQTWTGADHAETG